MTKKKEKDVIYLSVQFKLSTKSYHYTKKQLSAQANNEGLDGNDEELTDALLKRGLMRHGADFEFRPILQKDEIMMVYNRLQKERRVYH